MQHEHEHRHAYGCRGARRDFATSGADPVYPPDLSIEPFHLDVVYRFDLESQSVDGKVTHSVRGKSGGPTRLVLHAVDFEDVACTGVDGKAVSFRYDGKEITVDWDEPFEDGEERQLVVTFRFEKPSTGMFFSKPCETFPDRAWYAATDNETERARHWLPTVDLPSVRCTLDWHLTADERFTILANGALQSETSNGDGTKTAHWKLEQPCPSYLSCLAVGDFVCHDDGEYEGRPVASYTSQKFTSADLERSFGRTKKMLAWMEKKLGREFPYPKYYQFALPGFGGAMENISLVAWDDIFVLDEVLAKEWTWLVDQINVHEMAHSYFGDLIVCRDFAHAWLKESWATYMEQLWLEDEYGKHESDYNFLHNIERYCTEADKRYKRPIVTRKFDHSWHMYDGHLYPGGGSRLHMLRRELGCSVFFEGVRRYVDRYAFQTVETDDFRRTLEEVSGKSLGKWFDQWIHGKGYPVVKASFSYDKKSKQATFSVEQTQADEEAGIPVFEMSLDLGWVIDGELHTRRVDIDKAKHVFVVSMDAEPEQVRIDPENRTVMKLELDPGEDKLLTQLTDAKDVVGRIRAARTLLDGGKRKRVEAVRDAYRKESFWGVRVEIAAALADAGSQAGVEALAELIGEEQHGMVLESLIRSAGKVRAPEIRAAVEARLDAGIELYRARQAAFDALGAQRADAPVVRLKEAASTAHDPYGLGRAGAFRALAASRHEDAVDVLSAHTAPGTCSNRSRGAAVTSLGAAGRWIDRHRRDAVREQLEDLLRDPVDRVRDAATAGLVALGEPAAIGALEAHKGTLSDQEAADIDRKVAALRAAAAAKDPTAKDEAMDELRKQVRKLEDSLEKLTARVEGIHGKLNGDDEK
jgi:aminopeptidase N